MALRVSFFTGRPLQALANPFKRWPWYYYVFAGPGGLVSLFQAVRDVPTGTVAELVVVNFALVVLLLVDSAMNQSPHRVQPPWVDEMRRIAAQPVPSPDDPRSKDWAGDGDWPPS